MRFGKGQRPGRDNFPFYRDPGTIANVGGIDDERGPVIAGTPYFAVCCALTHSIRINREHLTTEFFEIVVQKLHLRASLGQLSRFPATPPDDAEVALRSIRQH
jgi:hypothetical protein